MALVRAVKNGNWSDTTVWNTGSLPLAADVVRSNNFTVTIDIDVTVTEIRSDAGGGAVAGGVFVINTGGLTISATNGFYESRGGSDRLIRCEHSSGTVTLNGNLIGGNSARVVALTTNATVIHNGNVTGINAILVSNGFFTTNGNVIGFFVISVSSFGTYTLNGNFTFTNTTSQSQTGISITSGTLNINGNIIVSPTQGFCTGISIIGGIVNITGDISITTNISATIAISNSGAIVNITGTINGPTTIGTVNQTIITNGAGGTINVTGNIVGGSSTGVGSSVGIDNTSTGTININGSVQGGNVTAGTGLIGIRNSNVGTINIIGNVTGGIGNSNIINTIVNTGSGTINITGNAIGGISGTAVTNYSSNGTINLNGNAIGGLSFHAIEGVNLLANTIIEKAIYTAQGQSPISGYIKFKTTNPEIDVLREDAVIVTLRDPLNVSGLLPNTSDVRSGTTYNNGSSTGTLAMPANNLVQLGVPVGATFGTANLTPGDFWNYLISNGFTGGSIGERLKETATTDIVGNIVASFNI